MSVESSVQNLNTSSHLPVGLAKRTLARVVDFFILFVLALVMGMALSMVSTIFNPDGFQAYLNYSNQVDIFNLELNGNRKYEAGELFNCNQAQNKEICINAEQFSINQTAFILSSFVFLQIIYFTLLTSSKFQATLGKLLFSIKVVRNDYGSPSWLQSITREIFFILFFLSTILTLYLSQAQIIGSILEIIILISTFKIVFSKDKTSLHDNLAYTKVISK